MKTGYFQKRVEELTPYQKDIALKNLKSLANDEEIEFYDGDSDGDYIINMYLLDNGEAFGLNIEKRPFSMYEKFIMCLDSEIASIPDNGFNNVQSVLKYYKSLSEERILEIFENYYGDE